jgi:uncharacterized repeat protein (TIGR04076 family)
MERRQFLTGTMAASACALAGIGLPAAAARKDEAQAQKKYACKLTVLRRGFEKEYADRFRNGQGAPCPRFKDGQEFTITSQWALPAGFCEWAWGDIRTYIHDVFAGASGTTVACCTDGFRPVFFKIERVDA